MASLVSIASAARAQRAVPVIAATLLLAMSLIPWREGRRSGPELACGQRECTDASVAADTQRPMIVMPLPVLPPVPAVVAPNAFDSWGFADMRPWPAGMVIGLSPAGAPSVDDGMIAGRRSGVLDSLLSALGSALLWIQT